MAVPKMANNGFNSVLYASAVFKIDGYSKKPRTNVKPKTALDSRKANKNHFRPI